MCWKDCCFTPHNKRVSLAISLNQFQETGQGGCDTANIVGNKEPRQWNNVTKLSEENTEKDAMIFLLEFVRAFFVWESALPHIKDEPPSQTSQSKSLSTSTKDGRESRTFTWSISQTIGYGWLSSIIFQHNLSIISCFCRSSEKESQKITQTPSFPLGRIFRREGRDFN